MWSRSSISPAVWVGCQPSRSCVSALEAGRSMPANMANQPKCPAASSGDSETTGIFRPRPMRLGDRPGRDALLGDGVVSAPGVPFSRARR